MDVPVVVRNKAAAAGAHAWLDDLPSLIAQLESAWGLTAGRPYDGGTEAYVAEATCADGRPAVLKLVVPGGGSETHDEVAVLRLAGGYGCAELYRADVTRGALLMERLGPSVFDLKLPIAQRHRILCNVASRIWRPAPDCGLKTGAQKAAWLIDHIVVTWEQLDRPCSTRAVDHAVGSAERRAAAHDDERAVVVHGDVQQWNVLRSEDDYKLIDPDALLAEAEYDLGVMMREDPLDLLAGDPWRRARWLARRCQLDATAIWEWGVVERVSTGLLATKIGLQPDGHQLLAVADRLAPR
ncbi:MAG: aminoglycoside phosphotransferase family protein [Euzebya sp.]